MRSYIIKPKTVRKSEILEKEFSLSGFSYRYVKPKNNNYSLLGSLLKEKVKGFEPGSKEYMNLSQNQILFDKL